MCTNPPNKPKPRFANPQPLNFGTRVGQKIVHGGFRVGDWDNSFAGLGERLKREKVSLEEKNRSLCADTRVLERCVEVGLSMGQVQQLAARAGCDILYLLGLNPQTLKPLSSRCWLSIAAEICSVSYLSVITPEVLLELLTTGNFPQSVSQSVSYFIEDAALQVVVMAVETAAGESGIEISVIWRHVAQIAMTMSSARLAPVTKSNMNRRPNMF